MPSPSMVIPVVIAQHAEAAAFHWLLRDAAVGAPHYSLDDLAKLDNRLDAHIDGLRIAGEAGWEMCQEQLVWEEAGEVFVAAVLAFESGQETRRQVVFEAGRAAPELARAVVSALGWLSSQQAEPYLTPLLTAEAADRRRIGIAACAAHRRDPGYPLTVALSDHDTALRARALQAVGQLGRVDLLPILQHDLTTDDDRCQYAAAWSATLLGDLSVVSTLQAIAQSDAPCKEEVTKMALRRMDLPTAHDWRQSLGRTTDGIRLSVIGAGVMGDPVSIPWLIEQMTIPGLARVAGEAFTMITGVNIAYEDLDGEWPEGFEAGPTENPEDENVDMDPDEDLPWPDPERINEWWYNHRREFQPGTRHLLGKPISFEWLQDVLRHGMQRQRAAAALELAMRQPGQPLFEVRAPGFRQQQLLRNTR